MDQPGSGVSGPRQSKPALEAVPHVGWLLVTAEAKNLVIGISSNPDQSRNITATIRVSYSEDGFTKCAFLGGAH